MYRAFVYYIYIFYYLDMAPELSLLFSSSLLHTVKRVNTYSVRGKCSEMLATDVVMLVVGKRRYINNSFLIIKITYALYRKFR